MTALSALMAAVLALPTGPVALPVLMAAVTVPTLLVPVALSEYRR